MKDEVQLFTPNHLAGGYSIALRNRWSYKIHRIHIKESEKQAYEQEIGDKVLFEDEFYDWLEKYKRKAYSQ